MTWLWIDRRVPQEVREMLDPDKGGIGGSARSGEAEERVELLAQKREELAQNERVLEVARKELEGLGSNTEKGRREVRLYIYIYILLFFSGACAHLQR